MNKKNRIIIIAVIIVITGFSVWFFGKIIAYILISAVLSIIGNPLVKLLNRIKFGKFQFPNTLSAVITLAVLFASIFLIFSIFVPIIINQANLISTINIQTFTSSISQPMEYVQGILYKYGIATQNEPMDKFVYAKLVGFINVNKFSDVFNSFFSFAGSLFAAVFSIGFITFFFLKDEQMFLKGIMMLTPEEYQTEVKHILFETKRMLTRYFVGLCLDLTIVITLMTLGMMIIGVKNALLIGFFAGILNVIPYVGPIIGGLMGILLGLTANVGADFYTGMLPLAYKMGAIFLVVNIIDAILFQPYIFSNSVKAHPLEIFLVILMAATIAGIPGMILAIPCYTVLRIIAKEFFIRFSFVKNLTRNL
jgi:predicted PurR-regulated permease PerM